jgi:hypothetical protein
MKNRTFFLTSLPLAVTALGLQVVGWNGLASSAAATCIFMMARLSAPPLFQSAVDHSSDGDFFRVLIWIGLALAIVSLVCLTVSFRRHESGRRFIPGIVLTLYLGTWVFLWLTSGL